MTMSVVKHKVALVTCTGMGKVFCTGVQDRSLAGSRFEAQQRSHHMQRRCVNWKMAAPALAALLMLAIGAGTGRAAHTDPPQPLPKNIVTAWKEAGAEVGWLRPSQAGYFWFVWEEGTGERSHFGESGVRLVEHRVVALRVCSDQVLSRSQSLMIEAESLNVSSSRCTLSSPQSAGSSCWKS